MGGDSTYVSMLLGILTFLVLLGIFAPGIQMITGNPTTTTSLGPVTRMYMNVTPATTTLPTESGNVLTNIGTALVYQFNWMPAWMIILHWVLRVILLVILYLLVTEAIP